MINYILIALILVVTHYIIGLIFLPSDKFSNLLRALAAIGITFLVNKVSEENLTYETQLLLSVFIVEFIILIILIQNRHKDLNKSGIILMYLFFSILASLVARQCYSDDLAKKNEIVKEKEEVKKFKRKYDFDVDSVSISNTDTKKANSQHYRKPRFPIIIYRNEDDKIIFDLQFNENLDLKYKSYKHDSIQTLIILKDTIENIGYYNNNITKAQKAVTNIDILDFKTLTHLKELFIKGSEPPNNMSFPRSYTPPAITGAKPNLDEILLELAKYIKSDSNNHK
ncbi:MAG TPA: hypothetical protein VK590_13000 [Saprospiraceae bacterium]|nr:hypothetical protein [Saprospiraceae bacterium]